MTWEILVPQPGIKPVPPAVEAQCPNHWTTREVPYTFYFRDFKAWFWEGVPRLHHTAEESRTQVILRTFVIAVQLSQAQFSSQWNGH